MLIIVLPMGEDFRSAPVPIRLSCRYSNGTVVSCVARALSYDETSLRVLSAEDFEKGVLLNVLAPFMGGIVACRVSGHARNNDFPHYIELVLQFVKKPSPVSHPIRNPPTKAAPDIFSKEELRAAREFALQLEENPGMVFSKVFGTVPLARHQLLLAITAAALGIVFHEKGALDLKHLIGVLSRKE